MREHDWHPSHLLLTHHHIDHVSNMAELITAFPELVVCAHPLEAARLDFKVSQPLEHQDKLTAGPFTVKALHVPGHTDGQLSFLVQSPAARALFTGDTLFRGSIGGTRGTGHTTVAELRHSLMEILAAVPHDTPIYPGHTETTTLAREWDENPFYRFWRGLEPSMDAPCTAFNKPAILLVQARDYDGGSKCLVRFADGSEDIGPGFARPVRLARQRIPGAPGSKP